MTCPSAGGEYRSQESPLGSGEPALEIDGERGIVWILDDSPLEGEMARRAISPRHDVTVFEDGAMMLEHLAQGAGPDALVLDWQLPGMSGIDVCRFLRGSRSQIALPIVMLTVHGNKHDVVEGLAAGANDHVTKPYDASELAARVGTLVHTRKLHERVRRAERALEVERDRLLQSERRFRFLARASIALASSLDSKAASTSMTRLVVPEIADWCGIYLRGQRTGALAADVPDRSKEVDHVGLLAESEPLLPAAPHGVAKVLQTGCADLVGDVESAGDLAVGGQAAELRALAKAGVASWMMVPLMVQNRAFGCLAFAITTSGRRFDEVDLLLAEELGRRTAVAIDNARLFEMTQHERARVEEANRTKDEFLATVSHELRTPLSAILGWVVMLGGGKLSEEKRVRAIATIERNARSQAQLIEDLLDISRIISGKLRLTLSPLYPFGVLEAAIDTVRPSAEAKGVLLESVLDALAGPILGDSERLQQVVWNLLVNAVKFTPKGGRVAVRLRRLPSEIEIAVEDTGRGIAPEFLPHMFERFRQADMGIERSHAGLGLGLAITRHLVELHGGAIRATSAGEGLGATVSFRLPLAPPAAASVFRSDHPPESTPGRTSLPLALPPELVGLRILVVEDEADGRDLLVSLLESCQAEVTAASSAAEALELFRRRPPDLLVSDIGMPGASGYELIRTIRGLPPEQGGRTPAVALTAYTRMEDRTRALMMGFDMHIPKPIEPAELLVVLAHLASPFPSAATPEQP